MSGNHNASYATRLLVNLRVEGNCACARRMDKLARAAGRTREMGADGADFNGVYAANLCRPLRNQGLNRSGFATIVRRQEPVDSGKSTGWHNIAGFGGNKVARVQTRHQQPVRNNGDAMRFFQTMAAMLAAALIIAWQPPARAEDKVIVVVNGHEIKTSEVELAAEDISTQLAELPAKMRFPFLVEYLVERHLLAQAAVKKGIADSAEYKKRLAFYQAKALRDAFFNDAIKPTVTEDEMKAAYEKEAPKIKVSERVRARHILVASEKEAREVADRLAKGEKFEDIAKKVSLDGSKDYGGDLGYFSAEEMVPEFSKAAFALKVGEVSTPIKTDYGWHVIKLEDRKAGGAQPYDQVKNGIKAVLTRKKVQEAVTTLRKQAKIEVIDPDLKKLQELSLKKMEELKKKQQGQGGEGATSGKQDLKIQE
jgi:peptidyl-prolyl cis-trans isomerase C